MNYSIASNCYLIFSFLLGSALPQILTSVLRCNTILFPNMEPIVIVAFPEKPEIIRIRISNFNLIFFKA